MRNVPVRADLSSIKNLIFDLGGVILDLSVDHTLESFSRLSRMDTGNVRRIFQSDPGFEEYEKGNMDDDDFRAFVREIYGIKASDDEIDRCWNAMLRGLPAEKLILLDRLKKSYNVLLLSNTNGIHLNHINGTMVPNAGLDGYFHRAYYSHRMKKRKPDAEIFEQVLAESRLLPGETLFLDDNKLNTEGAARVGIKSVHVTSPDFILEYFHA